MAAPFFTELQRAESGLARAGRLDFGGGVIVETPAFMPVGTAGTIKGVWLEDVRGIGYRLILGNTYHLYLRPGAERIRRLGGLARLIGWDDGAILTDSGGYQVFSLADRVKFRHEGVEFKSHLDGSAHLFTPASVIDVQTDFGSNIMMPLDDCPPADAPPERVRESLDRTHRWIGEALAHYARRADEGRLDPDRQRIFGIAQGCLDPALRRESLEYIQSTAVAGVAVGGLSVGETREDLHAMLHVIGPWLDPGRPRYLMGVGAAPDLIAAVENGFDMFDCVLATRNARNGQLFTSRGKVNIRNSQYADSDSAPDPECQCRVCRRYSLAYLRHLFQAEEMLGPMMASLHNLHFFHDLMAKMRSAIRSGAWREFRERWQKIPF